MTTKHTFRENVLRVIAVLGLLAVLLLGAWGIIQLAFFISSLFNNAGGAVSNVAQTHETITISVPSLATVGTPANVSWKLQGGSGNYAYTVVYSCVDGLSFKAPVPTGATQTIGCDTPFNYTQATESLAITPVYAGTSDAKTTITVTATKLSTGAIAASASNTMTVAATKKAAAVKATTSTSPKTTYVAANRTAALYGYPDLAVSITSAYSRNGSAAVQFVIQNMGTNVTPANWSFNAILPINGSYTYPSGPQRALYPGDKIVYSMGFSDYNNYGSNTYNNGYTYGTCNMYGPCAVPGYSGGCGTTPCGYTQPYSNWTPYQPAANVYSNYNYGYNQYGYNQNKNVTITIDPYNYVQELTKVNNSATASYISY